MATDVARPGHRDGSSGSSHSSRRSGSRSPARGSFSALQVEQSVTGVLISIKMLLECLQDWSKGKATEFDVSDVYVRLGNDFNNCVIAFTTCGISMELRSMPEELRSVLEATLSEAATPETLEQFLPPVRKVITDFLHGLRDRQAAFRQIGADRMPRSSEGQDSTEYELGPRRSSSQSRPPSPLGVPDEEQPATPQPLRMAPIHLDFLVDRTAVLDYWLCLDEDQRRSLVETDKRMVMKKLNQQHAESPCDCVNCSSKLALVETELAARYDTYADELEAFVSRHFEDMDDTIASGVSRPNTVSGRDALLSCTVFLKSRVHTEGDALDTSHSQVCFSTFGPNITSSVDVQAMANSVLENGSDLLPTLLEELLLVERTCTKSTSILETGGAVVLANKWPEARRNVERRQAFSIFATRLLEHRVISAYRKAEMKRERLRNFRRVQSQRSDIVTFSGPVLTTGMTLFKPGEIEIDYTQPVNTSGASCDLLCGHHPLSGKVALKRLRSDMGGSGRLHQFLGEVKVWQSLSHSHLLPFLGLMIDGDITLVSPFVGNGSVPDYLLKNPEADRPKFVHELASGLAYLHENDVIHGDVKGANTLVASDTRLLLCDFGLAKSSGSVTSSSLAGKGSLRWQAPELMGHEPTKTSKSDVYAFGMTIFEILSGKVPFEEYSTCGAVVTAVYLNNERPAQEPSSSPSGLAYGRVWGVAERCWDSTPVHRPSMELVLLALGEAASLTLLSESMQ